MQFAAFITHWVQGRFSDSPWTEFIAHMRHAFVNTVMLGLGPCLVLMTNWYKNIKRVTVEGGKLSIYRDTVESIDISPTLRVNGLRDKQGTLRFVEIYSPKLVARIWLGFDLVELQTLLSSAGITWVDKKVPWYLSHTRLTAWLIFPILGFVFVLTLGYLFPGCN